MDRLTKRIRGNVYYTKGEYDATLPAECEAWDVREILKALAAYEDTGLTPERCAELAKTEREGRLRIAPCTDGTEIYFANEEEAESIMESIGGEVRHFYAHGFTEYVYGDFEKDWFTTREEPESEV